MTFKNFIAVFGITLALGGCASMQPVAQADKSFERVVLAPNHTKDQIYTSTKIWMAQTFKSSKAVIEMDSKEDGIIIGNGIMPYPCANSMDCIAKKSWTVPFTMRVDIKDGRFKVGFSNIKLSWPGTYGAIASPGYDGPVHAQGDMDLIKPVLLSFGDDMLASMNNNKRNSNW